MPEVDDEKGKITVQFVGENQPPIEYIFEANETIQDLLSAPSINPNSLHLLAFLDATSNHMPLSSRCPLKKVQDDIIYLSLETTLLVINQDGKFEEPVHYERNLILRDLLTHYRKFTISFLHSHNSLGKTTAFIVMEGGSASRIKDYNVLVWDLGLKEGMKLAIMGDAPVDSDDAEKTPEPEKQDPPTAQPEPEKDETLPEPTTPRPATPPTDTDNQTPKIIIPTPILKPPETKKDTDSQGTSDSGNEPTLYLSTSSNPGSTENIEFGEQDTVQTLLDEEEFNPDHIFSAFLDPEGTSPLDPKTPLSQLQDKQLYFFVPPEEEEPSILLTSSIMDPGESETIEFGDDDTVQTLLDEEDYNPDGNMIAYLDPEGKGEPLDPKTPLSALKNKQIYFLPPPGKGFFFCLII